MTVRTGQVALRFRFALLQPGGSGEMTLLVQAPDDTRTKSWMERS